MTSKNYLNNQFIKKPGELSFYTKENINELLKSANDVIYFCKNFVKIQHPVYGAVKFNLYPYQERLLETFKNNKYVIALTARQMGKCVCGNTKIFYNNKKENIGSLLFKYLNFREKIIYVLEKILLKLLKKKYIDEN